MSRKNAIPARGFPQVVGNTKQGTKGRWVACEAPDEIDHDIQIKICLFVI
jgi:hypothetical protein